MNHFYNILLIIMPEFSKYKEIWKELSKEQELPTKCSGVIEISYNEFKDLSDKFDLNKAKKLVSNFLDGKVLLVKSAFSVDQVKDIKSKVIKFWKTQPDTFHKMIEGCPDFHRIITPERAKLYSNTGVKHSAYFFRWNKDPYGIKEVFNEKWRYCKYIAGLNFREYENYTPKDGAVDRIQVICWPKNSGGMETHVDPHHNNYLVISCYFSSIKNSDFSTGGFYCVGNDNKNIYMENSIDLGDMGLFIPSIEHGVLRIDSEIEEKNYDWNSGIGRWRVGLFTDDSDMKKNRITTQSLGTLE